MSQKCSRYAQDCSSGCCDKFGECPEFSGKPCFYYYGPKAKDNAVNTAMFVVAVSLGVVALLVALWLCFRRKTSQIETRSMATADGFTQKTTYYNPQPTFVRQLPPQSYAPPTTPIALPPPQPPVTLTKQTIIQTSQPTTFSQQLSSATAGSISMAPSLMQSQQPVGAMNTSSPSVVSQETVIVRNVYPGEVEAARAAAQAQAAAGQVMRRTVDRVTVQPGVPAAQSIRQTSVKTMAVSPGAVRMAAPSVKIQPEKVSFHMPDTHGQQYILEDQSIAEKLSARPPYIPPPIPLNSVKRLDLISENGFAPVSVLVTSEPDLGIQQQSSGQPFYKRPKELLGYNTSTPTRPGAATMLLGENLTYAAQRSVNQYGSMRGV